ncbi:hypothetical protein SFRURICE_017065, partial [Spodoptera frugiperda]
MSLIPYFLLTVDIKIVIKQKYELALRLMKSKRKRVRRSDRFVHSHRPIRAPNFPLIHFRSKGT